MEGKEPRLFCTSELELGEIFFAEFLLQGSGLVFAKSGFNKPMKRKEKAEKRNIPA